MMMFVFVINRLDFCGHCIGVALKRRAVDVYAALSSERMHKVFFFIQFI